MKTNKLSGFTQHKFKTHFLLCTGKSQNKEHFDSLHTNLISVKTYTFSLLRYNSYSTKNISQCIK